MGRKLDLITLSFEVNHLARELKRDWEYISEEIDRWGESFSYDNPKTSENESYELVREHIKQFEKKYCMAINAGLGKHLLLSKILKKGVKYTTRIKTGDFLRLNLRLNNMKDHI